MLGLFLAPDSSAGLKNVCIALVLVEDLATAPLSLSISLFVPACVHVCIQYLHDLTICAYTIHTYMSECVLVSTFVCMHLRMYAPLKRNPLRKSSSQLCGGEHS